MPSLGCSRSCGAASTTGWLGIGPRQSIAGPTRSKRTIEVASSDQHTVKPLLSSQLDFSPPVKDLQAEGFTLLGARLDYLERRPVATLVYRYRLHGIDVFVRPATRASRRVPLITVRGFNVSHALGAGMEWWAVSDAAPDVLAALVERLARYDAP